MPWCGTMPLCMQVRTLAFVPFRTCFSSVNTVEPSTMIDKYRIYALVAISFASTKKLLTRSMLPCRSLATLFPRWALQDCASSCRPARAVPTEKTVRRDGAQ